MTLHDDILAVLESTKLPLTIGDIIQDVAVMPVARGEPMRQVYPAEVVAAVVLLIRRGVIESGLNDGGAELVYRFWRATLGVNLGLEGVAGCGLDRRG